MSLKERRNQLGLTLREVQAITDGRISNAYLSQLESGKIKTPSLKVALDLAAVLCVPVETIAEWVMDPPKVIPPLRCKTCGQRLMRDADAPTQEGQ